MKFIVVYWLVLTLCGCNSSATPLPANRTIGEDYFAAKGTEWYSAFNQPSAQYRNGKTYIVYPDENYDPAVIYFDHDQAAWSKAVKAGKNPLPTGDSHGNPSLLIDMDGYLHVFYGCHGAGGLKYARSAKPNSIDEWVAMSDPAPSATYPQVMQMSNGTIYLFYRAGGHVDDWVFRTSDNNGNSWSESTAVLRGVDPTDSWYASFAKGPMDTVHVGFVYEDEANSLNAVGPQFTHRYDVYYIQRKTDGSWINGGGEAITLPVARDYAQEKCKVFDSSSQGQFTGACSLGVDQNNAPYFLFRVGGAYGTTIYQHKLAKLYSGAWEIYNVGPPVNCNFQSYVRDDNFLLQVISPELVNAYVVNTIAANTPVMTNLEQWVSSDGGRTWDLKKTIFSSSEYHADYTLISPKLVAEANFEGYLVFGLNKRYLYGDVGFMKNNHPE